MSAAELWNTSWLAIEEAGVAKGSKIYDTIKSYTGADQVDADAKHKGFGKKEIPAMLMLMSNRAPSFFVVSYLSYRIDCGGFFDATKCL